MQEQSSAQNGNGSHNGSDPAPPGAPNGLPPLGMGILYGSSNRRPGVEYTPEEERLIQAMEEQVPMPAVREFVEKMAHEIVEISATRPIVTLPVHVMALSSPLTVESQRVVYHLEGHLPEQRRFEIMREVGTKIAQDMPEVGLIVLITESWMVRVDGNRASAEAAPRGFPQAAQDATQPLIGAGAPWTRPTDDPQRVEVITIAGSSIDGRGHSVILTIKRDADECMSLSRMDVPEGTVEFSSPLMDSIMQGYAVSYLQALAQARGGKS